MLFCDLSLTLVKRLPAKQHGLIYPTENSAHPGEVGGVKGLWETEAKGSWVSQLIVLAIMSHSATNVQGASPCTIRPLSLPSSQNFRSSTFWPSVDSLSSCAPPSSVISQPNPPRPPPHVCLLPPVSMGPLNLPPPEAHYFTRTANRSQSVPESMSTNCRGLKGVCQKFSPPGTCECDFIWEKVL